MASCLTPPPPTSDHHHHPAPPPTTNLENEQTRSFSLLVVVLLHFHPPPTSKMSAYARFRGFDIHFLDIHVFTLLIHVFKLIYNINFLFYYLGQGWLRLAQPSRARVRVGKIWSGPGLAQPVDSVSVEWTLVGTMRNFLIVRLAK